MAAYPNVDIANKWAKQVVLNKIPACKWIKLACERHLSDLKSSKNKEIELSSEFKIEKQIEIMETMYAFCFEKLKIKNENGEINISYKSPFRYF